MARKQAYSDAATPDMRDKLYEETKEIIAHFEAEGKVPD